jgi:hypothetical protein
MCQAIAECFRIDEAKDIRDRAKALEVYAKEALNFEAERKAAQIRIRAERRAGELLQEMKKRGERDPGNGGDRKSPSTATTVIQSNKPSTLQDIGITRDQSSQWQKLAEIPLEEFEEAVTQPGPPVSTRALIIAHEQKTFPPPKPIPTDALWLCGILEELERFFQKKDITLLLNQMTEDMRADVLRISPQLAHRLEEISHETKHFRGTTNGHRAG